MFTAFAPGPQKDFRIWHANSHTFHDSKSKSTSSWYLRRKHFVQHKRKCRSGIFYRGHELLKKLVQVVQRHFSGRITSIDGSPPQYTNQLLPCRPGSSLKNVPVAGSMYRACI